MNIEKAIADLESAIDKNLHVTVTVKVHGGAYTVGEATFHLPTNEADVGVSMTFGGSSTTLPAFAARVQAMEKFAGYLRSVLCGSMK